METSSRVSWSCQFAARAPAAWRALRGGQVRHQHGHDGAAAASGQAAAGRAAGSPRRAPRRGPRSSMAKAGLAASCRHGGLVDRNLAQGRGEGVGPAQGDPVQGGPVVGGQDDDRRGGWSRPAARTAGRRWRRCRRSRRGGPRPAGAGRPVGRAGRPRPGSHPPARPGPPGSAGYQEPLRTGWRIVLMAILLEAAGRVIVPGIR